MGRVHMEYFDKDFLRVRMERVLFSILNDLDDEKSPSNQLSSTCRNRSISSIINEEIVSSARSTNNKRKLVVCNCLDCDGDLVDSPITRLRSFWKRPVVAAMKAVKDLIQRSETSTPTSAEQMIDESIRQESEESDNSNQDD
ncbi:4074_t:CDS:2, partial [Rhizophagus irregularis]